MSFPSSNFKKVPNHDAIVMKNVDFTVLIGHTLKSIRPFLAGIMVPITIKKIAKFIDTPENQARGIKIQCAPISISTLDQYRAKRLTFTIAFPIECPIAQQNILKSSCFSGDKKSGFEYLELSKCDVLSLTYKGPLKAQKEDPYLTLLHYSKEQHVPLSGYWWEILLDNPRDVGLKNTRTEILTPIETKI